MSDEGWVGKGPTVRGSASSREEPERFKWGAPGECIDCGQPSCICKKQPKKSFTELLREAEREIARDPEAYGTTAEEWERIRQWPGEK